MSRFFSFHQGRWSETECICFAHQAGHQGAGYCLTDRRAANSHIQAASVRTQQYQVGLCRASATCIFFKKALVLLKHDRGRDLNRPHGSPQAACEYPSLPSDRCTDASLCSEAAATMQQHRKSVSCGCCTTRHFLRGGHPRGEAASSVFASRTSWKYCPVNTLPCTCLADQPCGSAVYCPVSIMQLADTAAAQ